METRKKRVLLLMWTMISVSMLMSMSSLSSVWALASAMWVTAVRMRACVSYDFGRFFFPYG